jgi:hypothetical protein
MATYITTLSVLRFISLTNTVNFKVGWQYTMMTMGTTVPTSPRWMALPLLSICWLQKQGSADCPQALAVNVLKLF